MYGVYAALSVYLDAIERDVPGIYNPEYFQNIIFVHNSSYLWSNAEIHYGENVLPIEGIKPVGIAQCTKNSILQNAQDFKLFLIH